MESPASEGGAPRCSCTLLLRWLWVVAFLPVVLVGCDDGPDSPTFEEPDDSTDQLDPWVVAHADPIGSLIELDDFSDLQPLKEYIGDRRIVQLGESGHGVAEFNLAKDRLIRFLHEEMGFDVVAFESSLYECFAAGRDRGIRSGQNLMARCIYGVWHTWEVVPLFDHILSSKYTDQPIDLVGFDMKPSSYTGIQSRPAFMQEVVARVDEEYADLVYQREVELVRTTTTGDWRAKLAVEAEDWREFYQLLLEFFDGRTGDFEAAYSSDPEIPLIAREMVWATLNMLEYSEASVSGVSCSGGEVRDRGMAEIFNYLADRVYPDRKIIVWAHNYHIRHLNVSTSTEGYPGCYTMGQGIAGSHRDEMYTVGLYMDRGQAAMNDRTIYTILPGSPGTLAGYLKRGGGHPYLFLDILGLEAADTPSWIKGTVIARSWGTNNVTMTLRDQYDGILFIQEVSPPDYAY